MSRPSECGDRPWQGCPRPCLSLMEGLPWQPRVGAAGRGGALSLATGRADGADKLSQMHEVSSRLAETSLDKG
jgi:hypothetical protein